MWSITEHIKICHLIRENISNVLDWQLDKQKSRWLHAYLDQDTIIIILGQNGIYFTWVAASYRGETRGLWINASPRERSLVKFHLSEFRFWKGFSPWGNHGSNIADPFQSILLTYSICIFRQADTGSVFIVPHQHHTKLWIPVMKSSGIQN